MRLERQEKLSRNARVEDTMENARTLNSRECYNNLVTASSNIFIIKIQENEEIRSSKNVSGNSASLEKVLSIMCGLLSL